MATTPYRKLQERVQELEDISNAHQKQNGDLHTKIADLETIINLLKDRLTMFESEVDDLKILCHLIKVSNYFENIRASQMKQVKDIVDINYVA